MQPRRSVIPQRRERLSLLRDTLSRLNASAVNHKCATVDMNVAYFCLQTHFLIPAGKNGLVVAAQRKKKKKKSCLLASSLLKPLQVN